MYKLASKEQDTRERDLRSHSRNFLVKCDKTWHQQDIAWHDSILNQGNKIQMPGILLQIKWEHFVIRKECRITHLCSCDLFTRDIYSQSDSSQSVLQSELAVCCFNRIILPVSSRRGQYCSSTVAWVSYTENDLTERFRITHFRCILLSTLCILSHCCSLCDRWLIVSNTLWE